MEHLIQSMFCYSLEEQPSRNHSNKVTDGVRNISGKIEQQDGFLDDKDKSKQYAFP